MPIKTLQSFQDLIAQKKLGERMKKVREDCGLQQKKVAADAKTSANMLGQWESGSADPGTVKFLRWCVAVKIHPCDFFLDVKALESVASPSMTPEERKALRKLIKDMTRVLKHLELDPPDDEPEAEAEKGESP